MILRSATCWLGLIAMTGSAFGADGPFRDIKLDQALKEAAKESKQFVLVDFYTVWCAPCKKLDETTWKDTSVKEWLAKEGVCLKVDAEKEETLAAKFRINVYPTVLLLKPDGSEVDRLVGYRDASTFLADARESLAGNDSLSRARKALEGENKNDPMLRMNYADQLVQKGRTEDALSEYLWCFDHGLEHRRSFTGVRVSFLLSKIGALGQPALDELRKRRDSAMKDLETVKGNFDVAMGFSALNKTLEETEKTLALYDKIKDNESRPAPIRHYLFGESLEPLLKAKRYRDIVSHVDPKAKVNELIARHEGNKVRFPDNEQLRTFMKRQVCVDGARYYEAVAGAGDSSAAAEIAALLTGFDAPEAYPALRDAAKRAGNEEVSRQLEEAGKKK